MPKLSEFSPDQIEVVSAPPDATRPGGALKLSQLRPDTVEIVSTPKPMGLADKAFQAVENAGSTVLSMPIVSGPIQWVGDKLERYVDAPVRAQIGALQGGKSIGESYRAGGRQLGEDTLPTTPSGKEIMARAGISTKSLSDVAPGLFSDTGEGAALKRGGILDISPAGVAGGLAQPSTFAIPADALLAGVSKVGGLGAKVAGKAAEAISPLAEAVQAGAQGARKGIFKVGEVMTGGTLKAADAMKAADQLKGTQLLVPEASLRSAGKAVGAARDAIEGSGKVLTDPAAVEKLQNVKSIIEAGEQKAMRTPGSQALLERIDNALTNPQGVPVEAVDDMIRDLNGVEYTERGNPRSLEPRWAKPLAQARGELEPLLKSTPEGSTLSSAKQPFAALKTAQGGGSNLRGIASWAGGVAGASAGAVLGGPIGAAATFLASRAIAPRTYFQIVGASKLPAQAVKTLTDAFSAGKASVIGEAMTQIAEKYPEEMTKIATAVTAESGRADDAVKRRLIQGGSN